MAQQASGPTSGSFSGISFDPVDWERRVAEARARRELALARRARATGSGDRAADTGARRTDKEPQGAPWLRHPAPRAPGRAAARLPSASQAMSAATGAFSAASGVLELALPRRRTRLGILFGSGLALGLVAAASLLLRDGDPAPQPFPAEVAAPAPAPDTPAAAPDTNVAAITSPAPSRPEPAVEPLRLSPPEAVAEAPAGATAVAESPAVTEAAPVTLTAATGEARIFVHVPSGARPATTDAVLGALTNAGLPVAGLVPVRLEVGRSNLRYYHSEDAALAEEIAAALAATPVGATEARNFAELANPPPPGTVEIWLAGDSTPGPAPTMPMALEAAETPLARPEPRDSGIDPQVIQHLVEAARDGSG
jgi:hypothetical protein